jgi:hypothetical protein
VPPHFFSAPRIRIFNTIFAPLRMRPCAPLLAFMLATAVASPAREVNAYAAPPSTMESASAAPARKVNWYVGGGAVAANVAFALENSSALTGMYLCCNSYSWHPNGSFSGISDAEALSMVTPLSPPSLPLSPPLELIFVVSVSNESIASGSWAGNVDVAAATAARVGVRGFVVDYEPVTNYTVAHAQAYAAFLTALADALHARGLVLGADVAGWSILDRWDVYAPTPVDFFTSMTPTYFGSNLTMNEAFVSGALAAGIAPSRFGTGIGTILAPGCKPEWDYKWTQSALDTFLGWVGGQGVGRVDFWRADIDHYQQTADWVVEAAAAYLKAGPSAPAAPASLPSSSRAAAPRPLLPRRTTFVATTNSGSSSFQPLADLFIAHSASWTTASAYCSSPGEVTNETVLPSPPFCYNNWTVPIRLAAPHVYHVPIIILGEKSFVHPYIFAAKYVQWALQWGFDGYVLDVEFKSDDAALVAFLDVFADMLHNASLSLGVFLYPDLGKAKYVENTRVDYFLGTYDAKSCGTELTDFLWGLHHSYPAKGNLMLYQSDAACSGSEIEAAFSTMGQAGVKEIGYWANAADMGAGWYDAMANWTGNGTNATAR